MDILSGGGITPEVTSWIDHELQEADLNNLSMKLLRKAAESKFGKLDKDTFKGYVKSRVTDLLTNKDVANSVAAPPAAANDDENQWAAADLLADAAMDLNEQSGGAQRATAGDDEQQQEQEQAQEEDDDEEIDEDYKASKSSSKKRKRKTKKKSSASKKRPSRRSAASARSSAAVDGDEEEAHAGTDERPVVSNKDEVTLLFDSMKKKKYEQRNDLQRMESVKDFLFRMNEAFDRDVASFERGEPSTHKLAMIDEVESVLKKTPLHQLLVSFGFLRAIKKWLDPLPDGQLPIKRIRSVLLNGLLHLPIGKEDLLDSNIGRVVNFLHQTEDDDQNRKVCERLKAEWTKGIFNKVVDYSQMMKKITLVPTKDLVQPTSLSAGQSSSVNIAATVPDVVIERSEISGKIRRPRVNVPQKVAFENPTLFPMSEINVEEKGKRKRENVVPEVQKRFQDKLDLVKKSKRSQNKRAKTVDIARVVL